MKNQPSEMNLKPKRTIPPVPGWLAMVCAGILGSLGADALPVPDDVQLTMVVGGQPQTLNLHKRTARTPDFKLYTWDSANGYVLVPTPEVRTYRGTIAENPNAVVVASIDTKNMLRAYCFDLEYSHNLRWAATFDVNAQLASPVSPVAMPAQTAAAPRNGSAGTPMVGSKVPTGTAANGVKYGEMIEYELGGDLLVPAYNAVGKNVEDTLNAYERLSMIYEQMMARSCLIRVTLPTVVVRKENFYSTDPGAVGLEALKTEWNKAPLKDTKWDCVWATEGWYSNASMGHGYGVGAGALYHENTHNWGAVHLAYQCDTMGGNKPSIGPLTFEKIIATRKSNIDAGRMPQGTHYADPIHPFTHVDTARVVVNTPQDIDVLANDWDTNGDTLTVSNFTTTTKQGGTVTLNGNGTLRYTPPAGFVGKDMIVYSAQDSSTMGLKTKDLVHIQVVNNDLMARYSFDETSGTTAADATGLSPIANLNGADFATDSVLSPLGRGVRASGWQNDNHVEGGNWSGIMLGDARAMPDEQTLYPSADWVTPFETAFNQRGGGFDILNGNYTFSTWFRGDNFGGEKYLASKWWHNEQKFGWDIRIAGNKLHVDWRIFNGTQGNQTLSSPAYAFVPGKWYHAAGVFDRVTGEIRLYLNGSKVATRTNAFSSNGTIFEGRTPLVLGCYTNRTFCFDDTRIYSKALTDSDVQSLYSEPGSVPRFLIPSLAIATHTGIAVKKPLWGSIWHGGDDVLTFSMVSGPAWLSVNASGELTGTPAAGDIGTTTAVVRMMDSNGDYADLTVNLTVASSLLRAHWHFDEGSGTTAADSSGAGKTATLQGATWGTPSREGPSSLLTDSTAGNYTQAPTLDTTGGFTLCAWIKPGVFVGKHTIVSQQGSYAFKINGSTLALDIPSVADHNSPSGLLATGLPSSWQHVVVTFNPSTAGGVKFYVNGALKSTLDASTFSQSSFPTLIGKTTDWTNQNYSGGIDDLRVYGSVLGADEILTISKESSTFTAPVFTADPITRVSAIEGVDYSASLTGTATDADAEEVLTYSKISGPAWLAITPDGTLSGTPSGSDAGDNSFTVMVTDITGLTDTATLNLFVKVHLAAHWKFDEGSGATAVDSSETGNNATLYTSSTWGFARAGASALVLNGTDPHYAHAATIHPGGGFTLAAWIKPTVLTGDRSIVTQLGSYGFNTRGTGLVLRALGVSDHATPSGLLVTGQWQHVAVSFNPGTTGGAKFYVNGALVATVDASALVENSNVTIIGRTSLQSGINFSGSLDDIHAFGLPVSGTEIADLYNSYPGMTAPVFTIDPMTGAPGGGHGAYAGTLAGSATDADGDPGTVLKYSRVSGPAWLTVATDGTLSGSVPPAPGLNTFVVKVTDNTGLTDTATLNITGNANNPPSFTSTPITGSGAIEDSAYSGTLTSYGTDPDGGTLTYVKASGPAWLNIAPNGELSGTPGNSDVGTNVFTLKVLDPWAASATATLNITVTNINDAPTFATDPIIKSETVCLVAYSGSISGDASDVDVGDTFTFSKVSGPAWLSVASNGTLSGTPADSDGGLNSFTVRVTDAASASTTATLQINVTGIAWSNPAGGSWITTGNWNGGVIASGANKIANFTNLNLTANAAVTLDGARTIGHLTFGDTTPSHNWTLNTGSAGPLTLDVASGTPQITVKNQTATIGLVLAGNDGLTKAGSGTLVLAGANTYTGPTTISNGRLTVTGKLGASAHVASGATLEFNSASYNTSPANWSGGLSGSGVVEINYGSSASGQMQRFTGNNTAFAGSVNVLSGKRLNLENVNSASANAAWIVTTFLSTQVANGTFEFGSLSGSGTLSTGGTGTNPLHKIGALNTNTTFSGIISGTVKLEKVGTGTLTLSGANNHTGATTISGGTLSVTGSMANTTTTVQSGGKLGGTGTLGDTVTVQSGGTLAPGVGGIGTLTLANKTLTSSGTVTMEIGRTGATLSADRIAGVSTLTFGGTLAVTSVGEDAFQLGDVFQLFSATNYVGSFATYNLPILEPGLYWKVSHLAIDGSLEVTDQGPGLRVNPYADWAAIQGVGSLSEDADHDGMSNLLEFYLTGDPRDSGASGRPELTVNPTYLIFTFQREDEAEGPLGNQRVQWGSELTGWKEIVIGASSSGPDANGVTVQISENGIAPDSITVSIPREAAVDGKLFVRLKVGE